MTRIVFVCEHGAAKSILAATYFNKLAHEKGLNITAIARGTHPDPELSLKTMDGLLEDGLTPSESAPQKLLLTDVENAQCIISFCDLPAEYRRNMPVEQWDDVPPVSENYKTARDAILERLERLIAELN
jgi:arsenate reductase (thioredoxin)